MRQIVMIKVLKKNHTEDEFAKKKRNKNIDMHQLLRNRDIQ